jgi:hypothetical protein
LSNSFISFSFIIIIISVLLCNKGDKGEPYWMQLCDFKTFL